MEHPQSCVEIILGVDTHLDVHVGVVIDTAGRVMGTLSVGTNHAGYQQLLCWAQKFGVLRRAGVEGTGSYGAALTQLLQGSGVTVIEINRPDRSRRRGRGKSDVTDAESAARSVLAGDASAIPKAHNGLAEALRTLNLVRRSAVKAKTQTINQIRALLVSAPQAIRDVAYQADASKCVAACAALAPEAVSAALASLQAALRLLAKRWTALSDELRELDAALARLDQKGRSQAVVAVRCGAANGRYLAGGRWRQSDPASQRGGAGRSLRNQSATGIFRQGPPPSAQPWWRSPGQQRAVDHCHGSHAK